MSRRLQYIIGLKGIIDENILQIRTSILLIKRANAWA